MIITPIFVILLIITFAVVWLFINTIDKRKWLTFLISIVITPIAYFYMLYPAINIFSSYHHEKHFESKTWEKAPNLRFEMLDNIITDSLLIGKSKQETKALLGESEWYGWDDTIKENTPEKWNYNLGFKPGAFNKMQECIELEFINNTVKKVRHYQLEKTFE